MTQFLADSDYKQWLADLKSRIKQSQIKAAVSVNYELLNLYWELGKEILIRQENYAWGEGFLKALSRDLKHSFPEISGFSEENLKKIRYWYKFYTQDDLFSSSENKTNNVIGLQAVTQFEALIKSIPWGHNQRIMYKCQTVPQALFYVQKTLENGWSRSILEHQIDSKLYERQGKAISNFEVRLPSEQSDLAQQTLKDPYNFDFLTLRENYDERELESRLVEKITQFLLELGTGFAYMGRQVHIQVGKSDFYMDLLFYHVRLRCYVVVELKTEKFKPEFAGKLNFYVTAVNRQIKSIQDNPTIGILICKDKDDIVAEYALSDMSQPIGISEYQITQCLSEEFKSSLPTIEEIEKELE
ncbi:PDDEXK nuclease domain-containing protein [Actinobacillus genomosp. 1]|uniref:PDDEXK nuclease domain-containing protein n=1 Tax=Actinobacillus genomosp. 1 TaxID=254839 RepID=UPI002440FB9A|nr:PDDEXK nuclease domain-containing protein [Actinobacillus genomosp. 1]WGE34539.1 PDDEXK nuclease domain-containing protein [Actinobacillus genomosp. 1]WGE36585.1 PDDEXK nuclease domain-containing protein [Actinobacillus genomosp. 1]WGE91936.1 PDDEXK nuclease domain-containing protein [Actinobacillus genomosp. 1]